MFEPRYRSVGFLEQDDQAWACFLVTFQERAGHWRGYFSFRPKDGGRPNGEIRTADIFLESSEGEIERKARGLGRPLLGGLLSSALHTTRRRAERSARLSEDFRTILAHNSQELQEGWDGANAEEAGDAGSQQEPGRQWSPAKQREPEERLESDGSAGENLRSLYESYRLDQVAHFIALLQPEDFDEAVDRILEGQAVDFGTRDRIQFAMIVVEHIEAHLPLPPFEVWARDFTENRDVYARYAHALHREGRLP